VWIALQLLIEEDEEEGDARHHTHDNLLAAVKTILIADMKVMDRFPIVVYAGAALIAWTTGEMMDSDHAVEPLLPSFMHGTPYLAIALTVGVVGYGWWSNARKARSAHDVLEADKHAAQRMEDRID
jgi:hypothetical protein